MKIKVRELALLVVGFVIGAVVVFLLTPRPVHNAPTPPASQIDPTAQRCFNTLLAATAAGDYSQFVSVANDTFRRAITPSRFDSISQSLGPRMQHGGCTPTYLGQFRQNGTQVSLWRLAFTDGGDDRLARMNMSQDRVNGFVVTPAF
jgi:hypothetical protein